MKIYKCISIVLILYKFKGHMHEYIAIFIMLIKTLVISLTKFNNVTMCVLKIHIFLISKAMMTDNCTDNLRRVKQIYI